MKPKERHFEHDYISETASQRKPLNAFRAGVERYIEIRQGWLDRGSSSFGWRGKLAGGRLFFNRRKTEQNINIMRNILNIIDDEHRPFKQKVTAISSLKHRLTAKGQGRKLVETFTSTALSEESAYIPSREALENSIYVAPEATYHRKEVLGKGAFGQVSRFQNERTGRKVVLKGMHKEDTEDDALEYEAYLFQQVYNLLGRPYFGIDAISAALPQPVSGESVKRVVMPEIPGGNLIAFIRDYPDYDEEALFFSIFNFLWRMHKELRIVHNDCHCGNIMILDAFYNVFFIDFGLAGQLVDNGFDMAHKREVFYRVMRKDIGRIIINMFYLRKLVGKVKDISLAEVRAKYNLDRWQGLAFHSGEQSMEYSLYDFVENKLLEKSMSARFIV